MIQTPHRGWPSPRALSQFRCHFRRAPFKFRNSVVRDSQLLLVVEVGHLNTTPQSFRFLHRTGFLLRPLNFIFTPQFGHFHRSPVTFIRIGLTVRSFMNLSAGRA